MAPIKSGFACLNPHCLGVDVSVIHFPNRQKPSKIICLMIHLFLLYLSSLDGVLHSQIQFPTYAHFMASIVNLRPE
jgi:hypothetical protein